MALDKFNWQNGSQVEPAKVEVEGVSYDVVDAQFEGETPLSASNLNLMQDTLLSNVKDNLEDESKIASCKAVKDVYSTTETKTNKVWKDGKPIYRNWVSFLNPSLSPGSSVNVEHGIPNIDTVVGTEKWQAREKNSTSRTAFLPSMTTNGNFTIIYNANETHIVVRTRDTWTAGGYYFEGYIEYTKTTD